ncbi:hypothetical protein VSDG_02541 [Cytospora chrysosperma]|uniref:Uncharacterized protein n=1 Tax=Cytospora chrysosperma TaxID=252740 RepID=A0A423WFQ8_CYTCH|nr:hypothetical protein VSDG_02541 [Valsa sordida]
MDSHFSTYSSATLVNQCDSDEDFDFKRSDEPLNGNPKLGAPFIKLENISSNDPDVPVLSIESAQRPDKFKTEEERDEHIELIVSSPCQKRVYDTSTEISARVAKQLQKRVESACGLYEQWFSVWDTIFPGIVRPATCTYDICSELPVQVLGLYSYLENEGPGAVISVLQRHGLSITFESLQPMPLDLQTYIRRVLFQACREICQNWQTQREQSSSPNSIHSNTGGARTSIEPSPQNRTNAAPYTPTSITNEGSSSASNIQAETSILQVRCVSESGAQSQPDHRSSRTPMATLDSNSNDNGFLWCTSTATYGAGTLDGYTPQYETFSTLQYPVENVDMADDVFDFDLSMPQHFSSGNRDFA